MKKKIVLVIALFCVALALGCQSTKCNSNTNCADSKPINNPWDALMAADGWVQKTLW